MYIYGPCSTKIVLGHAHVISLIRLPILDDQNYCSTFILNTIVYYFLDMMDNNFSAVCWHILNEIKLHPQVDIKSKSYISFMGKKDMILVF